MTIKRTEPTKGLLKGGQYTPAASTDIRSTFERARSAMAKPANVSALQRKARKATP